jgi:hypothetical protein
MYVLSAVCMDPYARICTFCRGYNVSYNGSFASVWINTSLNNQALTLAPDNLLLFSLLGAVGISEAHKRRCARLNLTPDLILQIY